MIGSIWLLYVYAIVIAVIIAIFWRLISKTNSKEKKDYIYTPNITLKKNHEIENNVVINTVDGVELINSIDVLKPYTKIKFLTEKECIFYEQLRVNFERNFNGNININLKVRLADLLTSNSITYFNKIKSKRIGFVITDKITAEVILLIELNDGSCEKERKVKNNMFVDEICRSVGYEIIHIPTTRYYDFSAVNIIINNA